MLRVMKIRDRFKKSIRGEIGKKPLEFAEGNTALPEKLRAVNAVVAY